MMKKLAILSAFAISLSHPSTAVACDCSTPRVDIAIAQAETIFTGLVTRIETTGVDGVLRVNIQVVELLKGQASSNFTIYSHPFGFSCLGYDFKVGREYVVFAIANDRSKDPVHLSGAPRAAHIAYLCGGTADIRNPIGDGNRWLQEVKQRLQRK